MINNVAARRLQGSSLYSPVVGMGDGAGYIAPSYPTPDYWLTEDFAVSRMYQTDDLSTPVTGNGQNVARWYTADGINFWRESDGPIYTTGVLNGLPGLKFNGTSDQLIFSGTFPASVWHNCTILIVASGWTAGAVRPLMMDVVGSADTLSLYINTTHNAIMQEPGVGIFHTSSATYNTAGDIFVFQYDQVNAETWDGLVSTGSSAASNAFVNTTLWGMGRQGLSYYNGYLHEIMIYTPKLSNSDREAATNYLKTKWGL